MLKWLMVTIEDYHVCLINQYYFDMEYCISLETFNNNNNNSSNGYNNGNNNNCSNN